MHRSSSLSPDNILRFLQVTPNGANLDGIERGLRLHKSDRRPLVRILAKLKKKKVIEEFPGGVNIFTPYSKDFVEDLKTEIPFQYRHWEPERKCWRVEDPYVDDAVEIETDVFDRHPSSFDFGNVEHVIKER